MMNKNHLKFALIGLGITGAITFGGVAVNLDNSEPVTEGGEVSPVVCAGEKVLVDGGDMCYDDSQYALLKNSLKAVDFVNKPAYLHTGTGRLHLAIINHEIKKDKNKGINPTNPHDGVELMQLGNNLF